MDRLFTYLPVLYEGEQRFEVIHASGRGTGIIRLTAQSANGIAQTLTNDAQRLIKQRARAEARKTCPSS